MLLSQTSPLGVELFSYANHALICKRQMDKIREEIKSYPFCFILESAVVRSGIEVFLRCENYVQAVNVVGFAMLYVVTHRLMKRETIIATGARHQQ